MRGSVLWIFLQGLFGAAFTVAVYLTATSMTADGQSIPYEWHKVLLIERRKLLLLSAVSFAVVGTIFSPAGTIAWMVGQIGSVSDWSRMFLKQTLIMVIAAAIASGINTHYLLLVWPDRTFRSVLRSLEIAVALVAFFWITVVLFTHIGGTSEEQKNPGLIVTSFQLFTFAVASHHATVYILYILHLLLGEKINSGPRV